MTKKDELNLIKRLSEADGIGAREGEIREIMKEEFLKYVSEKDISYDGLGSIIAKKSGNEGGPIILIASHMDEVGMLVSSITSDGFLKFQVDGDWWGQVMLAQQYTITTRDGKKYRAVSGSIPPHILTPNELLKPVSINDIYLDLGLSSKEEVEALGIQIGDMITPYINFQEMANKKCILGKALDNRIGCAASIRVLEELTKINHPNIVYIAGSVQEEEGLRSGETLAKLIKPDIAIALDTSVARDMPGCDNYVGIGRGPALLIRDNYFVGHAGLREKFIEVAERLNIPYQFDYLKRGGTDVGTMHTANAGCPSIPVCIETRYIHSHTSIVNKDDYDNAIKLLVEVIKELNQEVVNSITYK